MTDDARWDPERPTQPTCPACEARGDAFTARCDCCGGTGMVTSEERKRWLATHPEGDRPVLCPSCEGTGQLVEQRGLTSYRSRTCPCCTGAGVVRLARAREWRIAHAAGRRTE